jgi:hypothetical protein
MSFFKVSYRTVYSHSWLMVFIHFTLETSSVISSTGPAAEPSGRFPPPLLAGGGDGDPPCVLASGRWGPIYTAIHTQRMELWATSLKSYGC